MESFPRTMADVVETTYGAFGSFEYKGELSMRCTNRLTLGMALAATALMGAAEASADQIYIKVRQTAVRASAQHFARSVQSVRYGDALEELGEEGAWIKVKTKGGATGYVHSSALSSSKIVLTSSQGGGGAGPSASDVVLAGKGFNSAVEEQYAASNRDLDFRAIDRLEARRVAPAAVAEFARQGKLTVG